MPPSPRLPRFLGNAGAPGHRAKTHFEPPSPNRGSPALHRATKGRLVERDGEVLAELARRHEIRAAAISCASVDAALLRRLEPHSPTPERRFRAMAALAKRGVKVGPLTAPVLPFP